MRSIIVLLASALAFAACGVPDADESPAATDSSSQELLSPIDPLSDTRCAAQKISEQENDPSSGPYLFVACEDHPINVFRGQSIVRFDRDPNNGSLRRTVLNDTIQSTSSGLKMVEVTCAKNIVYHCPCGIGSEPVSGSVFPAFFCKSKPANSLP